MSAASRCGRPRRRLQGRCVERYETPLADPMPPAFLVTCEDCKRSAWVPAPLLDHLMQTGERPCGCTHG